MHTFGKQIPRMLLGLLAMLGASTLPAQTLVQMDRVAYTDLETTPNPENGVFGASLTRVGDYLLAAANQDSDYAGAVYVFRVEPDGTLDFRSKLTSTGTYRFGELVAGAGNWAAVVQSGSTGGQLQLFELVGDTFNFRQAIPLPTSGNVQITDIESVAMSGNTLMIGNYDAYVGAVRPGAVAVYRRDGSTWAFHSMITNPLPDANSTHLFGTSIAISGDTAVITDPQVYEGASLTGRAYLYERNASGGWELRKQLRPTPDDYGAAFARNVSVDADTVVIGCTNCNNDASSRASIYVYLRDEGGPDNWGQSQEISEADGELFSISDKPRSIHAQGDVLAFGSQTGLTKRMYVFTRLGMSTPLSLWGKLEIDDGGIINFGQATDGQATSYIVGAPNYPDIGGERLGAIYAFRVTGICHGGDTIYCDGFDGFR